MLAPRRARRAMTFDSVTFALFLPVVFLGYWALPTVRAQNLFLLAASYVFYGAWNWRFLGLILAMSLVCWVAGLGIERGRHKNAWLGVSLVTNLGTLGVFKYLDWGIASFSELLGLFGLEAHPDALGLVLPVGISFHTFQALSYAIDVHRGRMKATVDPIAFLTFVAFFPQLVAGPIERSTHILPQFSAPRVFDAQRATDGALQMLYGLVTKVVVADRLAEVVDAAYASPEEQSPWALLVATWAFAFQIYGDFAGYSHMAVGAARLFGFSLSRNFAYPYFSTSPGEFWDRWHISLSTWFRDYVYIPLGGSRVSAWRRRLNVFLVFVLSGVWHGAAWTFVAWGAFWGLWVALSPARDKTEADRPMGKGLVPRASDLVRAVLVFHVACVGWVFFRATSLESALTVLERLTLLPTTTIPPGVFDVALPIIVAFAGWEWMQRHAPHGLTLRHHGPLGRTAVALAVLVLCAAWGQVRTVPFIYFQF
jgi:D-alanyl-lipoteichoic acid acyltransferase DltB (MBOAT superfamily)